MPTIPSRFIYLRNAGPYFGVDNKCFNIETRSHLTLIPTGTQSDAYDRDEWDQWAERYKAEHGRRQPILRTNIKNPLDRLVRKETSLSFSISKRVSKSNWFRKPFSTKIKDPT